MDSFYIPVWGIALWWPQGTDLCTYLYCMISYQPVADV